MNNAVFPRMHVSLYVSNLDRTLEFYNQFFGRYPVKIKPKYAKYVLDQPSLIISFVEHESRVQSHFGHLGFQVETIEVMNEALIRMKEMGMTTREEMGTNCCYAKQDKFWVNDPDGVEWEVYYFHEDAEFNDPHYESEDNKSIENLSSTAPDPYYNPADLVVIHQACCDPALKESSLAARTPCC